MREIIKLIKKTKLGMGRVFTDGEVEINIREVHFKSKPLTFR